MTSVPFDPSGFKKSLHNLQGLQEEISRLCREAVSHPIAADAIYHLMLEEAAIGPARRLAIFYLCNDILQYSSRKQITEFLEKSAGIFFPGFTPYIHRLAISERRPYLRVIEIWKERRVFSENFCNRLINDWSGGIQKTRRETAPQSKKPKTELIARLAALAEVLSSINPASLLTSTDNLAKCISRDGPLIPIDVQQINAILPNLGVVENSLFDQLHKVSHAMLRLADFQDKYPVD